MKLSKADTARHLKISRQTLYEWIRQGRISVNDDGTIDSAEVARLSGGVSKPDVASIRHSGQLLTSAQPDMVDVYREMVDLLKAQFEESQRREAHYRALADRLTSMLADAQVQSQRLLEAPRQTVTPIPVESSGPQRRASVMPETWRQILDYVRQRNKPVRCVEVQEALGLDRTPRHIMNRMVLARVLRRIGIGVYAVPSQE